MSSKPAPGKQRARAKTMTVLSKEPKSFSLFFAEHLIPDEAYHKAIESFSDFLLDSRNLEPALKDLIQGPPYLLELVLSGAYTADSEK